MSKKYSGDLRHNSQNVSNSKSGSGAFKNSTPIKGKTINSKTHHTTNPDANIRSSKMKSSSGYMNDVDYEMSQVMQKQSIDNDGTDDDNICDTDEGSIASVDDARINMNDNKDGMQMFRNRDKYTNKLDLERSDVSNTPILDSLKMTSLVSTSAGKVQFHDNDVIAGGKINDAKRARKSELDDTTEVDMNYCDVLLRRYKWLDYLLQHGLQLKNLNDELLWSFENHCLKNAIDLGTYPKSMFKRYGSSMFDVVNWFKEG